MWQLQIITCGNLKAVYNIFGRFIIFKQTVIFSMSILSSVIISRYGRHVMRHVAIADYDLWQSCSVTSGKSEAHAWVILSRRMHSLWMSWHTSKFISLHV
jgi:hypothetical protein